MKREKFLMAALVACGCLTLASCEKSTSGSSSDGTVSINAMYVNADITELTSRVYTAATSKDDFFLEDNMGVYAWVQSAMGETAAPASLDGYQVNNVINIRQSDGSWLPEEDMTYSSNRSKYHSIIAMYPAQIASTDNGKILGNKSFNPSSYDYEIEEDTAPQDLLWAKTSDRKFQGPALKMDFTHTLAKVALKLNFVGNANTKDRNIKVEVEAPTKAIINYTAQTIIADIENKAKFVAVDTIYNVGTGSQVEISAVVIPHKLTSLWLTIGDGEAKEYKLLETYEETPAVKDDVTGDIIIPAVMAARVINILSGEQVTVEVDVNINIGDEPIGTTPAIAVSNWETGIVPSRDLTQAE